MLSFVNFVQHSQTVNIFNVYIDTCSPIVYNDFQRGDFVFANILIKLRKDAGYTQAELAKMLGMCKSAVSNYENGFRTPENETLIKLSKIFNVSIETLLGVSQSEQNIRYTHSLGLLNILNYSGQDESKTQLKSTMQYILDNISDETQLQQIKMFLETYKK